ncbi:DUF4271 domain-containing protein [Alloprevotella sp. OH1205_COT-284]|uniref:DUF4271 domain-containing protein n=1 Tax=Alloprevotella sp. OH1205_COT-284 TaxID=2491043 RepID=UPI000F5F7EA2|nr:DUF4271 domain-containing protein [Alloprevotella sp. OH1205_COT-284]RRD79986.1 DUF4271 domain-containing protein [Alloprevotella sp. OH1205_COT-284]
MTDSLTIVSPTALPTQADTLAPDDGMQRKRSVDFVVYEAADSVMQSHFGGEPSVLRKFETQLPTADAPEFPLPHDSTFLAGFRTLWNSHSRDITWTHESVPYRPQGIAGDPAPYKFRTDDYVTAALMLSFFLMVWVLASSWHFLRTMLRDFFAHRPHTNLFTDRVGALRGKFFLIMQTCFLQAVIYFDYTQEQMPDVFYQLSPYTLLLSSTVIIAVYYSVKIFLYRAVNSVFFSSERSKQWDNHLFVSILSTGCLLLPLSLLVVFFDLPFRETQTTYILLMAIVKSLLFYQCYRIFFNTLLGNLHIILYFCALEIVPLIFLWGFLVGVSRSLVVLA